MIFLPRPPSGAFFLSFFSKPVDLVGPNRYSTNISNDAYATGVEKMNITKLVDIRNQIAQLQNIEKMLAEEIKGLGAGRYEQGSYAATVYSVADRESLDAKAMEQKLRDMGVDNRWFSKNTKTTRGYTALKITEIK